MSDAAVSKGDSSNRVFEQALQAWTEIDLASMQKKLDEQGLELQHEQKLSLANKKNLAQQTKEFRKLDDAAKLAEFKSLLKLYQNEIDALSTKQKKTEGYFFAFYRAVAEAPDPKPLLEFSLTKAVESGEAHALKAEVARLNEELAKKADYDVLKQRLLRNEQHAAETLASRLKMKEDELMAVIDEKAANWAIIEKQHANQVAAYKSTIEELKTSMEVKELQLGSHTKQLDAPSSGASLAEVNLLTRDVESYKKRVYELERRNEDLRKQLTASQADSKEENFRQEFASKLADMEGENVLLLASLKQAKGKMDDLIKEHEAQRQVAEKGAQLAAHELAALKQKLEKTADYDDLKRELHLMRQIEFGEDADAEDAERNIDALLMERNKQLANELAELRSSQSSFTEKITSLENELKKATQDLNAARKTNLQLEADLADVQDANGSFNDTASLVSGMTRATRNTSKGSMMGAPSGVDEASILPIITKQRDRFRDKNKSLEEDARKMFTQLNDLKRKNKQLQQDNEELYEKTRYMASLKSAAKETCQAARPLVPRANVDLENPYQSSYESKLHPIEQFRQKEQERVNSRLSPLERLFIFVTRSVLATRTTRMLFFFYCVFLHCIVMFTTVYCVNLSTQLIPEVGLGHSTGGVAGANDAAEFNAGL